MYIHTHIQREGERGGEKEREEGEKGERKKEGGMEGKGGNRIE